MSNFLSLVLKIPSPKQESVEAISIGPGLNDGFKGRRMVAERGEAGASSVHHLDRATIRQIENTLPRIQHREYISKKMLSRMYFQEYNIENTPPKIHYREYTSKITLSRIRFREYNIENTLQRIFIENTLQRIQCQICTIIRQIPEPTSKDETHINNERGPRIQYQACTATSSNDSSDPRIHFTEYNFYAHVNVKFPVHRTKESQEKSINNTSTVHICKLFFWF